MNRPMSARHTPSLARLARRLLGCAAVFGALFSGCAESPRTFRAPLLLTAGELSRIAELKGELALDDVRGGRVSVGTHNAYVVRANTGAELSFTVATPRDTGAPVALAVYGPRSERGLFGAALAATRSPASVVSATVRAPSEGTYLVLVALLGSRAVDYQLTLGCAGECGATACPATACLLDCPTAFARSADGCERCACRPSEVAPSCVEGTRCGAGRTCQGGACVDGCGCADTFAPVCGRDGRTYASPCEASCFGATVASRGACAAEACGQAGPCAADERCETPTGQPPRCVRVERCGACPTTFEPVCGADGQTYGNRCLLDCAGVAQRRAGVCVASRSGCSDACTTDADCGARDVECANGQCQPRGCAPDRAVCGDDGNTYTSACDVPYCRGVRAVASGSCCRCAGDFAPVCGRDGQTYPNRCEAGCAGATVATEGACGGAACLPVACALTCPYGRRRDAAGCEQCACEEGPACAVDADCPNARQRCVGAVCRQTCACPESWAPVCGANGVTYRNACQAFCAGALSTAQEGACPRRTIVERGCEGCRRDSGALCGQDRQEYADECALCQAGIPSAGPAPCAPLACDCNTKVEPVCGVNGVTFGNACLAACVGVQVAAEGACPTVATADQCAAFGACELECPRGFEVDPESGCRTCTCRP